MGQTTNQPKNLCYDLDRGLAVLALLERDLEFPFFTED